MSYRYSFFAVVFVILFAIPVFAAHDRYVRLRYVEGNVTLYPSDEEGPVDATMNMPVMDGDEIATDDGRAELTFRNGIVVRIGDYSAVRIESSYSPMVIRLTEGTLFVDSHLVDSFGDELQVDAGDAQVFLIDEGNLRIDLGREGSARITAIQGEAEVRASGRRILIEAGERTYVDPGEDPERPEEFAGRIDELDDWNQSRLESYARGGYDQEYVDEDIYYDAYDPGNYGDWREYGSYGHVWVPHVSYGWRPYYDGRWRYCNNSWFWVSYEPWGWAPYHYGRWGWSIQFGWYWIPGDIFAPAWVGWYDYGDYIGWCPLSFYNRPIYVFNNIDYYQPIQKQRTLDVGDTWTFVKKRDLGVPNVKKAVLKGDVVKKIQIEDRKVVFNPSKQLVSYVMPTTKKTNGMVNDKRMVHESKPDIKNPIGLKHRDEDFMRKPSPESKSKMDVPKSKQSPVRNWEKERQQTPKEKPDIYVRPEKGRTDSQNGRDDQFERNVPDSKRHYGSYVSPYYREKSSNSDKTVSRDSKSDSKKEEREVNPRYLDEARKVFERFDERNHLTRPDMDYKQSNKGKSEPPRQDYRGSSPRPEPPSNNYRAPEPRRPDYSSKGNSGNSGKQEKSSRGSQPPPKQKKH